MWCTPGTMLIRIIGLPDVLHEVVAAGHEILGLEGFDLQVDGYHVPRLDLIYDRGSCGETAFEALAKWPANVWVDVTLTE